MKCSRIFLKITFFILSSPLDILFSVPPVASFDVLETSNAAFSTVFSTPPTKFLILFVAVFKTVFPSFAKQIEKENMAKTATTKETKIYLFIIFSSF